MVSGVVPPKTKLVAPTWGLVFLHIVMMGEILRSRFGNFPHWCSLVFFRHANGTFFPKLPDVHQLSMSRYTKVISCVEVETFHVLGVSLYLHIEYKILPVEDDLF